MYIPVIGPGVCGVCGREGFGVLGLRGVNGLAEGLSTCVFLTVAVVGGVIFSPIAVLQTAFALLLLLVFNTGVMSMTDLLLLLLLVLVILVRAI